MKQITLKAILPRCSLGSFCVLLAVAFLVLTCLGCSAANTGAAPQATANTDAAPNTAETDAAPQDTEEWVMSLPEGKLFLDKTMLITYDRFQETADEMLFHCTLENHSDDALQIVGRNISINGIVVRDKDFRCDVPPQGQDKATLSINKSVLRALEINGVRDVSIDCVFYQNGNLFRTYAGGVVRFDSTAADSHEAQVFAPHGETIYESEAVRVTTVPFLYTESEQLYSVVVCIENRTAGRIAVFWSYQSPDSYIGQSSEQGGRIEIDPGETISSVIENRTVNYNMDAVSAGDNIATLCADSSGSKPRDWDIGACKYDILTGAVTPAPQKTLNGAPVDVVLGFPQGSLYKDDNLSVDYLDCDKAFGGYCLYFTVTNTSSTDDWTIESDPILVNGTPLGESFSIETTAGSSVECRLGISQIELGNSSITDIREVTISCRAKKVGDSASDYQLPPLILRNEAAGE